MPHLVIEYSPPLSRQGAIRLCGELARALGALRKGDGSHEFPPSGTFVRAYEAQLMDPAAVEAGRSFLHAALRIGPSRSPATKEAAGTALLQSIQAFFAEAGTERPAISVELIEFPATLWRA